MNTLKHNNSVKHNIKVLVIDDENLIRETMIYYLSDLGYIPLDAPNGKQGIQIFEKEKPDIIFVDLCMPDMSGLDVISVISKQAPHKPIITISGIGVVQDAIEAMRRGAWDFISKPILDLGIIDQVIKRGIERSKLIIENETYKLELEKRVQQRTAELEKKHTQLQSLIDDIVNSLSTMTDKRDPYTSGHQKRVSFIAVAIAKQLNLTPHEIDGIRIASQLHDIGKIYVPAEFLSKPTRLDDEEMAVIKKHSIVGYEIIKDIQFPWPVADMVRHHHERLNGSGYPDGLKDSEISIGARIIAVSDVVEAMSSHRPYRPALGIDRALEEIKKNMSILYCPKCVNALLQRLSHDQNLTALLK